MFIIHCTHTHIYIYIHKQTVLCLLKEYLLCVFIEIIMDIKLEFGHVTLPSSDMFYKQLKHTLYISRSGVFVIELFLRHER